MFLFNICSLNFCFFLSQFSSHLRNYRFLTPLFFFYNQLRFFQITFKFFLIDLLKSLLFQLELIRIFPELPKYYNLLPFNSKKHYIISFQFQYNFHSKTYYNSGSHLCNSYNPGSYKYDSKTKSNSKSPSDYK